jgi:hypothetical protein
MDLVNACREVSATNTATLMAQHLLASGDLILSIVRCCCCCVVIAYSLVSLTFRSPILRILLL